MGWKIYKPRAKICLKEFVKLLELNFFRQFLAISNHSGPSNAARPQLQLKHPATSNSLLSDDGMINNFE